MAGQPVAGRLSRSELTVIRVIEDQITTLRPYNARYTVILAQFSEVVHGDDHPYITRSVLAVDTDTQARKDANSRQRELGARLAAGNRALTSDQRAALHRLCRLRPPLAARATGILDVIARVPRALTECRHDLDPEAVIALQQPGDHPPPPP